MRKATLPAFALALVFVLGACEDTTGPPMENNLGGLEIAPLASVVTSTTCPEAKFEGGKGYTGIDFPSYSHHGNSFQACLTGFLTQINLEYGRGSDPNLSGLTLEVFNGNTVSGGAAYTQNNVSLDGGWVEGGDPILLTTPFPVTAGNTYTFTINAPSPVGYANETSNGRSAYVDRTEAPACNVVYAAFFEPANQPPVADAGGPYTGYEGTAVLLDASASSDPDNDIILYEWDLDNDGTYDAAGEVLDNTWYNEISLTVVLRVTDADGTTDVSTATVDIYNVAPVCGPVSGPSVPVAVGDAVGFSAPYTDPGIYDSHFQAWDWGDGTVDAPAINSPGLAEASHAYATPDIYTVELKVTDDAGDNGWCAFPMVVVYDPSGGFVTGGGWIDSPAGAYKPDVTLSGNASFGFVSKYKKGATTPDGNTEFQFQVAGLNFHSDSYEWLIINQGGNNAQFKGTGLINGDIAPSGEPYKFMLWAGDDDPDTFRIKIWYESGGGEFVVYDNGSDQEIGGGSIVVHAK